MPDRSILVVDDESLNRQLLKKIFDEKYNIIEVEGGKEALYVILNRKDELAAILLDVMMPDIDGFAVMETIKKAGLEKKIPVVMITAEVSVDVERRSYQAGAVDLIHKPFDPFIVNERVSRAIDLYDNRNNLEKKVAEQTQVLRKQFLILKKQEENLRTTNTKIIDTICTIVEFRNLESGYHLRRIKGFTRILCNAIMNYYPEYKLTPHKIEVITQASAMHDIGKITVPDTILLKPGRLTAEEFDVMKSHTTRGCEILKMLEDIQDKEYYEISYDICRHHHERYDGRGYPDRLKGEEISIAAQATSLADVYDALVTDRVYKAAYTSDKAYEMIRNGECGVFSSKLLTVFEFCRPEIEELANKTKTAEMSEHDHDYYN